MSSDSSIPDLSPMHFAALVHAALIEDIGPGDITTSLCIPKGARATATMLAKSPGVVAGLDIAACAFQSMDPHSQWLPEVQDGVIVAKTPFVLARVTGDARALLTAERVALNFVQRLSGIATMTARYVERISGTQARIVDTRKTTPGLRALEKYAVRVGGGFNHRFGLFDAVLIKENHIRAAGGIAPAVAAARLGIPHTMKIEVETTNLTEVDEALKSGADIILLDNMDLATMRQAVQLVAGRAVTEASGGLTEDRLKDVAATGVDILSVGALTHSVPAMDISLDFAR